ncbi:hypothetical protein F5Y15DRAFT_25723 [Xylariaceae sp. FL0016]|nr:hypothetical protein F5Y15DRAFT_25723 [Xylariaceae sp. FL0016]
MVRHWASNPLLRPPSQPQTCPPLPSDTDVENQVADAAENHEGFKTPTDRFTPHQIFYIFIMDGLGAAIVSGGINFAIAYAMYTTSKEDRIALFQFPNTLAGDAGLTIILQCLVTWLIEAFVVNRDLCTGGVHPLGFIPEPRSRLARWFLFLDRAAETETETKPDQSRPQTCNAADGAAVVGSPSHWLLFLWSQVVRALLVAAAVFPFAFGASVGFLALVGRHDAGGGDWWYGRKWTPQLFKLVEGAVLGLVTTPLMVMFWLTRCGWALQRNEKLAGPR